jgi:hypothetical protein
VSKGPVRTVVAAALIGCALGCAPAQSSVDVPGELAAREAGRPTAELENLRAFAHLYGFVRFFHPTDAAADANWQSLAIAGVASVRDADAVGDLADRLDGLYRPYAPSMQLWTVDEPTPAIAEAPRARGELVYWQHQGFRGTPISLYRPPYRQVRVGADERSFRAFTEAPAPDARVDEELAADLRLRLPIVLDRDRAAEAQPRDEPSVAFDDADVRTAAVIEAWNVLRHFYPYQEAVTDDWDAILDDALHDVSDDATTEDTVGTLRRMIHRIHDGHGEVGHDGLPRRSTLPVRIELVRDAAVVTGTSWPEMFAVGDVVESIDGEPVVPSVARVAAELSGSEHWRRFKAAAWVVPSGPSGQVADIEVRRAGQQRTLSARFVRDAPPQPQRPDAIHRSDDGVFYVDLTRADWMEIEVRLPEIAAAPGVVFDLRGYPRDTHRVLEHLLREPEDASWMHVPRYVEPGGTPVGWQDIGWHLRPAEPRIEGAVAFLVSAESISYAESVLGYVEAHDLGTIIGSTPSAGTNGDIVRVDTVGGWWFIFTGMRVTHHDGRPFHLRGIAPGLVVEPTIAALQAGHDEQLEAALVNVRG